MISLNLVASETGVGIGPGGPELEEPTGLGVKVRGLSFGKISG